MHVRARLAVATLIVALWLPAAAAVQQTPQNRARVVPTGTAQIGGIVSTPGNGGPDRPLRRVMVRLTSNDLRGSRLAATDDQGRFVFTELPAGRYTLTGTKPGYLDMAYGAKRTRGAGTPVTLVDGQRDLSLKISMPRGSVVTGTIRDSTGRPMANASIDVLERTPVGDSVRFDGVARDTTDDRGVYRVFGLPAGTFVVVVTGVGQMTTAARQTTAAEVQWALQQPSPSATGGAYVSLPPAGPMVAFSPVYFPGTADPRSATPIAVETGAERSGVDFAIQFVPMVRVTGTMTRSDGRPPGGTVALQPEEVAGVQFTIPLRPLRATTATVSPTGEFEFGSVAPGRYSITARFGTQGGTFWAKEYVDVAGRDVSGVYLAMRPAPNIRGRVVFAADASTPRPSLESMSAQVTSPPTGGAGSSLRTSPAADGTFALQGVVPGSYNLTLTIGRAGLSSTGPAWTVKSVIVGGRDVLDRYFELPSGGDIDGVTITLTDKIATLSGKLIDSQGKAAPDYSVLLIPVDRSFWVERLQRSPRHVRPANDGTFSFSTVVPGEYYLAAATEIDARDLFNADYLEQFLPVATKLTIGEGEKKVQDLKIGGAAPVKRP